MAPQPQYHVRISERDLAPFIIALIILAFFMLVMCICIPAMWIRQTPLLGDDDAAQANPTNHVNAAENAVDEAAVEIDDLPAALPASVKDDGSGSDELTLHSPENVHEGADGQQAAPSEASQSNVSTPAIRVVPPESDEDKPRRNSWEVLPSRSSIDLSSGNNDMLQPLPRVAQT